MFLPKMFFRWTKSPFFFAILIACAYTAIMLFITIYLFHDSYHTTGFDLGIFTQDLKYTLQGKILYSPMAESQLAHHFSPVLFLLVPLYWLFPYAQMLLVVQALLIAFAGYLVYVIAREYSHSPRASLVIEGLFFVNPLVWGVALFDFHEVAFAIPALLVMFLGLKRKNWVYFSLGLLFALATKEDVVITIGIFGFVLMVADYWRHKKISKIALIIFCSALLTYAIGTTVSRLSSRGESPPILSYFVNRYDYISLPLNEAIPSAFHTIFSSGSLFLISAYLAPLALLPLLSPKWCIPALVVLFSDVMSTNLSQHTMLLQYSAAAIPFLFIAFIEVLPKVLANREIKLIIQNTRNRAIPYSLIFILVISLVIISEGRIKLASIPDKHDTALNQVISLVPDNASVSASNEIISHLCAHTNAYIFSWQGEGLAVAGDITKGVYGFPQNDTEYIVIDTNDWTSAFYAKQIPNTYKLVIDIDKVCLYQLRN